MLLMQLETKEKFAFLHIAHFIAQSDGNLGKREKCIIQDYCTEMGIDDIIFDLEVYNIEKCLSQFKSIKSQRILLLELMILVHIDDKFNHFEAKLMNDITKKFNIDKTQSKYASIWGKAVSALREQAILMTTDI